MHKFGHYFIVTILFILIASPAFCDEFEFAVAEKRFENFIRCELTRTSAIDHFKGKQFQITMIDLFNIQSESEIKIYTGAIQCFVDKSYHTLYAAVGTEQILETEQVQYFTIRKANFQILATELIRHPYKERCKWSQYWIDID